MAQTAVCNRHHSLDQQLCRWLLMSFDRLTSNELIMTQELIANMLGVRREGVTEAAGHLQKAGLIEYRRGHITMLDRAGLEARACECYAVVKKEFDRLLPAAIGKRATLSSSVTPECLSGISQNRNSGGSGQSMKTLSKGSSGLATADKFTRRHRSALSSGVTG